MEQKSIKKGSIEYLAYDLYKQENECLRSTLSNELKEVKPYINKEISASQKFAMGIIIFTAN